MIFLIRVAKNSPNSKPLKAFKPKVQTKSITTKVKNTHKQAVLIRGVHDKIPFLIKDKTSSEFSTPKAKFGVKKQKIKTNLNLFPFKGVRI
ncbi:hypothetical protein B11399_16730 (plasmid) [Campylobacter jejuni]|nr:hypothetical protein B11399_16730 [Campylobacter jejuni]